ncbi:DUF6082 family protein [Sphingosinithalassobacter sp. LHW66-3]|uniref:DUF6082 family protein n=1 Tax=Sphingosinithalassobacter sp. LHW66-3 TaxID=3424718 RepID=UPI003D6A4744
MRSKSSFWFAGLFAALIALFIAHLIVLGAGSRFSFISDVEHAKDISSALGLFGALFSGFAAFGLLYTIDLQRNALALQSKEIEQGSAMQIRMLHLELLKLSIEDPDLEKVWSGSEMPMTGKQSMYTNLILSHWETQYTSGLLSKQQLENLLTERMQGILVQFWEKHRASRKLHAAAAGNDHFAFHNLVDAAFESRTRSHKADSLGGESAIQPPD